MSYELDHVEKSCSCPCGKGQIVYGWGTNDWNQIREGMTEIWCGECNSKYRLADGGLLPKDFPEYKGDEELGIQMRELGMEIANYRGMRGHEYWTKEVLQTRKHRYLSEQEINESDKQKRSHSFYIAFYYSKNLAEKYTLKELKDAAEQIRNEKYSTKLHGIAKEIAEKHRWSFKTIKLKEVIIPLDVAIRNYDMYLLSDKEDEEYIKELKGRLKEIETEYYKDYPAYQEKRKKALIPYQLK